MVTPTSSDGPPSTRVWTTAGDGIGNLHRLRRPRPEPTSTQVLLAVEAVSLNYRDLLVIRGESTWRPAEPITPMSDAVGTVVAVGPDATRFAPGRRVSPMFLRHWRNGPLTAENYHSPTGGPITPGVLADHLLLDENDVEAVPDSLDPAQAATLPVAALTAWHAVAVRNRVGDGDSVLVHGTGGVALFATQFALALGARVVVTTSSRDKAERLAALGVHHVIDRGRTPDTTAEVLRWTAGRGVDHVVDTVGGANLNRSLRAVRIGGSIAFIGLLAGTAAPIDTYEFVTRNVDIHGIETGSAEMYRDMVAFVERHGITPVVDSVHSFDDVGEALRRLESGAHLGKIVLRPR